MPMLVHRLIYGLCSLSPNAIEEQIFFDVPTNVATQILNIAVCEHGVDSVKARLSTGNIPFEVEDDEIRLSAMKPEDQKKIGEIAKKKKLLFIEKKLLHQSCQ